MELSKSLLHVAGSAYRMLQDGECGFTEEEEEIVRRNLLNWMDNRHHYDEKSGRACIANIYYFKDDTHKEYAPYFDHEDIMGEYRRLRDELFGYTYWDFAVTLNVMFSNHHETLKKVSKKGEELLRMTGRMAVNFLNDEDTGHPTDKIWWYMNS